MLRQPWWLTLATLAVWLVALPVMLFAAEVPRLVATYCVARGLCFLLEQFGRAVEPPAALVRIKEAAAKSP